MPKLEGKQAMHEYCSGLCSNAIDDMTAIPQGVEFLAKKLSDKESFYSKTLKDIITLASGILKQMKPDVE